MTGAGMRAALAPVREALLRAARADADRTRAEAAHRADRTLAEARERADQIVAEARRLGAADSASVLAAARARARRHARGLVLRARRDAYDVLRAQARVAVAELRHEPGYAELRGGLETLVRRTLGAGARVREADGGGIVGEVPGRRMDCSLPGFADRAVAEVGDLT